MNGNSYKVYRHTTPSGKVYIGITQQQPEKRWQRGYGYAKNIVFYRAIKKYGWDNIRHDVIHDGLTEDEAKKIEVALIAEHNSTDRRYGYNVTAGGDYCANHHCSDEKKQMLREHWMGTGNPNARAVICLETLEVYETATEARKATGATKICDCCRRKHKHRTSGGYHWAYYDQTLPMSYYENLLIQYIEEESKPHVLTEEGKRKMREASIVAVMCVETGKIYSSLEEAVQAHGLQKPNICHCCRGNRRTAGGYHWQYA